MATYQFPDRFKLTRDQNRRFARSNIARLVYVNSRFEGITTTLPQTKTIIEGMGVSGVSIANMNKIIQLKRGWDYIINEAHPISLAVAKEINRIIARDESLEPGELRTGNGSVATEQGEYTPPQIDPNQEATFINTIIRDSTKSTTHQAMEIMYHGMRQQAFWDGNKRTATLLANKLMIDNGAGLINVPLDKWETWSNLIANFYFSVMSV